ncbi:MAG: RNA-binding S4 domain-containing protein [Gammaproteobacteria bacterium]
MDESIRIDKWLWVARFYKTRNIAGNAVDGGRVHVNGQRVKPSYRVKVDDVLQITHPDFKREVVVCGMAKHRRSASEAQMLYQESENSVAQRELITAQRKILSQGLPRTLKKPNKHERQKIRAMLGKSK